MTLYEALRFATDTNDGFQYISRVKSAVIDYLLALDASAKITDTTYFNHSAVPDLVARWPNERGERHVFLRNSYASILAASDERFIDSGDPIILSLENPEPGEIPEVPAESATRAASGAEVQPDLGVTEASDPNYPGGEVGGLAVAVQGKRTLVTDSRAIDVLNTSDTEESKSPLASLVRANFIRGGRGLVDTPAALGLVSAGDSTQPGTRDLIQRSFFEDAALRINRTAQLIAWASSDVFPPIDSATGEPVQLEGGQLSAAELGNVLPWLLRNRSEAASPKFWNYLASLTSLAALEGIRAALRGIDLTPLIVAGSRKWAAKRAAVGLALEPLDGEPRNTRVRFWSFEAGPLGIDVGDQRLSVAVNGQLIKDRGGSPTPAWETVRPDLEAAPLSRVALRGITRSVTIGAEQSDDISADVDSLTSSLDDRYFVNEVGLRFPKIEGKDGAAEVTVHFERGVVTGERDASLADVSHTALSLLEFRDSAGADEVKELLN